MINYFLEYPKTITFEDMFSTHYKYLICNHQDFSQDEQDLFFRFLDMKLEDVINSLLVEESLTTPEKGKTARDIVLENSDLYHLLLKLDEKLITKAKQYQKRIKLSKTEEDELKKIFTLFNVNINEQVAYLRRTENKDILTSKFLIKSFQTGFALYRESDRLNQIKRYNKFRFEYLHKTDERWFKPYLDYYKKAKINKPISDLTDDDWKKILPSGLYENGKLLLYYQQLNDIRAVMNSLMYSSMHYYCDLEEKPKIETVLSRNNYKINSMVLLQEMEYPFGNHNNSLYEMQNAKIANDINKKDSKPGRVNKIKNLQSICLDFDIDANPRFNDIKAFQAEISICLYGLLTTKYKCIPNFIVNTEHGAHVVFRIVKIAYSEENIRTWKETVKTMLITLSEFGLVADDEASLNPLFTIRLPFMRQQKNSFEDEYITSLARPVNNNIYSLDELQKAFSVDNFKKSELLLPKYKTILNPEGDSQKKCTNIHSLPLKNISTSYEIIYRHNAHIDAIINHDTETYKVLLASYNLSHAEIGWYDFCDYLKQINMHDIIGIQRPYFNCIFHDDKHPSASIFVKPNGHWIYKCHSANCSVWFTNISLIQILRHSIRENSNFGETVLWLAKVLDAKLEQKIDNIRFATEDILAELNANNIDIFNQICKNHPWLATLKDCYLCILLAFKEKVKKAYEANYMIPTFAIEKSFSTSYLSKCAELNNLNIKSESKVCIYLNILIALGFVQRLSEIPDWDTLNAKVKNTKKKRNTYNDISYYHYKELTNDDILVIEDNCSKIEAYFTEQYQKEFLETGKIHKYPYPVIKNITKKVLKEIFK